MAKKRPNGYWPNIDNCIAEAKAAMKKEGWETLPRGDVLEENGYGTLVYAITTYHGGMHAFRKHIGEQPLRREDGLWKDLAYALKEARAAMRKEGWAELPASTVLKEKGYGALIGAIMRYHGGFHKFRKHLRQQQLRREQGIWKNLDYVIQEAREAMRKEGWTYLPGKELLCKRGYGSLSSSITKYHGGFWKFRTLLGQENDRSAVGAWKDPTYTIAQARKAIKKEGWSTLPRQDVLSRQGYGGLAGAIARHHGGMHAFRKLVGEQPKKRESGVWQDLTYTINQAISVMQKEQWTRLPAADVLADRGYSSLNNAIKNYHGGYPVFREKLNAALGRNPGKDHLEEIIREYMK
jgi:hypothetical protein